MSDNPYESPEAVDDAKAPSRLAPSKSILLVVFAPGAFVSVVRFIELLTLPPAPNAIVIHLAVIFASMFVGICSITILVERLQLSMWKALLVAEAAAALVIVGFAGVSLLFESGHISLYFK